MIEDKGVMSSMCQSKKADTSWEDGIIVPNSSSFPVTMPYAM